MVSRSWGEETMTGCQNCGKQALFMVGPPENQVPMCLDCREKLGRVLAMQNDQFEREINYLTDQIEAVTGVPGLMPRFPTRPAAVAVHAAAPITFNNISVNNSSIGVLNTGSLKIVNSSITALASQPGGADLAKAIHVLATAIGNSTGLQDQARRDAMDIVSQIAAEATRPRAERRRGVIGPILTSLAELLGTTADLTALWTAYGPMIRGWFGL